ncbi:MAG: hypothetical protein Q7J98_01260, partial [Kiritimatiellia bacterium]|nr:hypothetical protein [Kiritimatiellia bacterium]
IFDYLVSVVSLKIWFIWRWLAEHPEEDFRYVFNNRVNILTKTVLNPNNLTAPPGKHPGIGRTAKPA